MIKTVGSEGQLSVKVTADDIRTATTWFTVSGSKATAKMAIKIMKDTDLSELVGIRFAPNGKLFNTETTDSTNPYLDGCAFIMNGSADHYMLQNIKMRNCCVHWEGAQQNSSLFSVGPGTENLTFATGNVVTYDATTGAVNAATRTGGMILAVGGKYTGVTLYRPYRFGFAATSAKQEAYWAEGWNVQGFDATKELDIAMNNAPTVIAIDCDLTDALNVSWKKYGQQYHQHTVIAAGTTVAKWFGSGTDYEDTSTRVYQKAGLKRLLFIGGSGGKVVTFNSTANTPQLLVPDISVLRTGMSTATSLAVGNDNKAQFLVFSAYAKPSNTSPTFTARTEVKWQFKKFGKWIVEKTYANAARIEESEGSAEAYKPIVLTDISVMSGRTATLVQAYTKAVTVDDFAALLHDYAIKTNDRRIDKGGNLFEIVGDDLVIEYQVWFDKNASVVLSVNNATKFITVKTDQLSEGAILKGVKSLTKSLAFKNNAVEDCRIEDKDGVRVTFKSDVDFNLLVQGVPTSTSGKTFEAKSTSTITASTESLSTATLAKAYDDDLVTSYISVDNGFFQIDFGSTSDHYNMLYLYTKGSLLDADISIDYGDGTFVKLKTVTKEDFDVLDLKNSATVYYDFIFPIKLPLHSFKQLKIQGNSVRYYDRDRAIKNSATWSGILQIFEFSFSKNTFKVFQDGVKTKTYGVSKGTPVTFAAWQEGKYLIKDTIQTSDGGVSYVLPFVANPYIETGYYAYNYIKGWIAAVTTSLDAKGLHINLPAMANAGSTAATSIETKVILHEAMGREPALKAELNDLGGELINIMEAKIKVNDPSIYLHRLSTLAKTTKVKLATFFEISAATTLLSSYELNPGNADGLFVLYEEHPPTVDMDLLVSKIEGSSVAKENTAQAAWLIGTESFKNTTALISDIKDVESDIKNTDKLISNNHHLDELTVEALIGHLPKTSFTFTRTSRNGFELWDTSETDLGTAAYKGTGSPLVIEKSDDEVWFVKELSAAEAMPKVLALQGMLMTSDNEVEIRVSIKHGGVWSDAGLKYYRMAAGIAHTFTWSTTSAHKAHAGAQMEGYRFGITTKLKTPGGGFGVQAQDFRVISVDVIQDINTIATNDAIAELPAKIADYVKTGTPISNSNAYFWQQIPVINTVLRFANDYNRLIMNQLLEGVEKIEDSDFSRNTRNNFTVITRLGADITSTAFKSTGLALILEVSNDSNVHLKKAYNDTQDLPRLVLFTVESTVALNYVELSLSITDERADNYDVDPDPNVYQLAAGAAYTFVWELTRANYSGHPALGIDGITIGVKTRSSAAAPIGAEDLKLINLTMIAADAARDLPALINGLPEKVGDFVKVGPPVTNSFYDYSKRHADTGRIARANTALNDLSLKTMLSPVSRDEDLTFSRSATQGFKAKSSTGTDLSSTAFKGTGTDLICQHLNSALYLEKEYSSSQPMPKVIFFEVENTASESNLVTIILQIKYGSTWYSVAEQKNFPCITHQPYTFAWQIEATSLSTAALKMDGVRFITHTSESASRHGCTDLKLINYSFLSDLSELDAVSVGKGSNDRIDELMQVVLETSPHMFDYSFSANHKNGFKVEKVDGTDLSSTAWLAGTTKAELNVKTGLVWLKKDYAPAQKWPSLVALTLQAEEDLYEGWPALTIEYNNTTEVHVYPVVDPAGLKREKGQEYTTVWLVDNNSLNQPVDTSATNVTALKFTIRTKDTATSAVVARHVSIENIRVITDAGTGSGSSGPTLDEIKAGLRSELGPDLDQITMIGQENHRLSELTIEALTGHLPKKEDLDFTRTNKQGFDAFNVSNTNVTASAFKTTGTQLVFDYAGQVSFQKEYSTTQPLPKVIVLEVENLGELNGVQIDLQVKHGLVWYERIAAVKEYNIKKNQAYKFVWSVVGSHLDDGSTKMDGVRFVISTKNRAAGGGFGTEVKDLRLINFNWIEDLRSSDVEDLIKALPQKIETAIIDDDDGVAVLQAIKDKLDIADTTEASVIKALVEYVVGTDTVISGSVADILEKVAKEETVKGGGVTAEMKTQLLELYKLAALKKGSPMTVTPTARTVDDIELEITGGGVCSTTVTRK